MSTQRESVDFSPGLLELGDGEIFRDPECLNLARWNIAQEINRSKQSPDKLAEVIQQNLKSGFLFSEEVELILKYDLEFPKPWNSQHVEKEIQAILLGGKTVVIPKFDTVSSTLIADKFGVKKNPNHAKEFGLQPKYLRDFLNNALKTLGE